jgi:hypothetical protein
MGLRGGEVTGERRKLHEEQLNDPYFSPIIIWVTKSRMRWTGHAARMGEDRCIQGSGGET